MNLLFFLTPKQDVLYICEDFTLRQTLEKWSNQRYATIPVLKRNGEYVGTITEGDILWGMKTLHGLDLEASEDVPIASFPRRRDYKAVTVTTDMRTLVAAAVDQNFVPVVDDRNVFIGIVPRTAIIKYMLRRMDASSETAQISGRCMSAVHRAMCSGVTSSSTSMRFAALPPMAPMSTAARTPLSPFVLGTMTDLTFFRILPHTATENRSGRTPSTSRARALA